MTDELPYPQPDAVTQPFWDGVAAGRLLLQRCRSCARHVFYPRAICPHCMAADLEWVEASGRGRIYSFSVVHRPPPGFPAEPYVVALVDLEEGVRMMTRLVDARPEEASVGLEVVLEISGDPPLPYATRADRRR